MCEYFVLPHITDPDTRQYYEQLSGNNWEAAKPEDFSWLISLLVKLPKSVKGQDLCSQPLGQSGLHPFLRIVR